MVVGNQRTVTAQYYNNNYYYDNRSNDSKTFYRKYSETDDQYAMWIDIFNDFHVSIITRVLILNDFSNINIVAIKK